MNIKYIAIAVLAIVLAAFGIYYVTTSHSPIPSAETVSVATTTDTVKPVGSVRHPVSVTTLPSKDGWFDGAAYIAANIVGPQPSLAIKNDVLYCHGNPLSPAANVKTLQAKEIKTSLYFRDSANVWVFSDPCFQVKGADPASFSFILDSKGYVAFTKDKSHVWISDSETIPGADPATFSFIARSGLQSGVSYQVTFVKDVQHVYIIEDNPCARGAACDSVTTTILTNADPATFSILQATNGGESGYEADAHSVYYFNQTVEGADRATFSVVATYDLQTGNLILLNGADAKDKNHSYLKGKIIR